MHTHGMLVTAMACRRTAGLLVIAEHLSARHLILQYSLATRCMYVCQSHTGMQL